MVAETTKPPATYAAPDMVWIFAGALMMGCDSHHPEEGPARRAFTVV
ncbi:MAG TPA: hypothetical protein VJ301_09295 [Propionibacteriaceae bacterium]|nr:hypothetical protein [Propionibacteriaceae bacterium]